MKQIKVRLVIRIDSIELIVFEFERAVTLD